MGHSVFWGAALAIAAAIGSNLGVNIQSKSHTMEARRRPVSAQRPYLKRPLWWVGMGGIIFGAVGDMLALGFAAQTLVASLGGGTTIFANVILAHYWLGQELYGTDILGVSLVVAGVLILAGASSEEGHYTIDQIYAMATAPGFLLYVILTAFLVAALLQRVKRSQAPTLRSVDDNDAVTSASSSVKNDENTTDDDDGSNVFPSPVQDSAFMTETVITQSPAKSLNSDEKLNVESHDEELLLIDAKLPLYWASISGIAGAQSVLLAKCVMEMVFESVRGGENQFKYVGTYVLIAGMIMSVVSQTHALNIACIHGDTMSAFPVFQAFWIGMSNVSGIVFFQQIHAFSLMQWVCVPTALVIVMTGIYLISKHESQGNRRREEQYAVAMPLTLGSPRQYKVVSQSFQYTTSTPQETLTEDDDNKIDLES